MMLIMTMTLVIIIIIIIIIIINSSLLICWHDIQKTNYTENTET